MWLIGRKIKENKFIALYQINIWKVYLDPVVGYYWRHGRAVSVTWPLIKVSYEKSPVHNSTGTFKIQWTISLYIHIYMRQRRLTFTSTYLCVKKVPRSQLHCRHLPQSFLHVSRVSTIPFEYWIVDTSLMNPSFTGNTSSDMLLNEFCFKF